MIKCAFDGEDKCLVLLEKSCEKCSFFKSKQKLIEGREKAEKRLKSLSDKKQSVIYDKYYSKRQVRPINGE